MENSIFRKKSLERIASPEQLNDYIKVTNPSVWILLGSIIVLLLGVVIWAVFGQLATTVSAVVLVEDGIATCYVREADAASVAPGDAVYIGGETYALESVSAEPVQASAVLDTVDNSQINVLTQRTMHRICTAATNEEVSFAYRVAIPRQRFRWRNAFSTRWRSL